MSIVKVKFDGNLTPSQLDEFVRLIARFQNKNESEINKVVDGGRWDDSFKLEIQKPVDRE